MTRRDVRTDTIPSGRPATLKTIEPRGSFGDLARPLAKARLSCDMSDATKLVVGTILVSLMGVVALVANGYLAAT